MTAMNTKMNKRGAVTIPADLRRLFGLTEGSPVVAEAREDGILLRPTTPFPVELYTPERRAEFLLGSAVDAEEYAEVVEEVRSWGLDPDTIPHCKPF